METQRKQKEVAMERKEQLRIETLRQKDEMCQSAVASPEVSKQIYLIQTIWFKKNVKIWTLVKYWKK